MTDEIKFFTALEEENQVIAQANLPHDAKGNITQDVLIARVRGEFSLISKNDVTLMDVGPAQLVSVAASLVPFLENDDANRALMGANMMRQAVPMVRVQAPLVGTGLERQVARDSGVTTVARRSGVIENVDGTRIVVKSDGSQEGDIGGDVDIYNLNKFQRSNQNSCINQRPVVRVGDRVEAGDIIADGPSTTSVSLRSGRTRSSPSCHGKGTTSRTLFSSLSAWFARTTSPRFTLRSSRWPRATPSSARKRSLRDIPNVGEEALRNLDESGIIRIGAYVRPQDILCGKITPKGETQLSPEEKLLRAIFGEKAGDVKDISSRSSR